MGAGGDAPPLRLQDVVMLVGLSLFVGSIVMLAWDDPVLLNVDDSVSGNARLGEGASVDVSYAVDQTSIVTLRFQMEGQDEVLITEALAAGDTGSQSFDVTERGKVTWSVSISEGTGEVDVDLKRGALSFALPPVLGALLVGYAVMLSLQGKNSTPEVQADLDAELLD